MSERQRARDSSSVIDGELVLAGGLFFATLWYWRHWLRHHPGHHDDEGDGPFGHLYRRLPRHQRFSISQRHVGHDHVSSRGQAALAPPIPYLHQFLECLQDPCDEHNNRKGHIALCVAENKLVLDLIAERFMQVGTATAAFADSSVYCYNSFLGMPVAREAAAYFLARRFLFANNPDLSPEVALQHVQPAHVALGSGAAALLNHLFFLLGEAGQACLVPAPYYAAFENDMNCVAGIVPVAVEQQDAVHGPTPAELDTAWRRAHTKGLTVRFLLVTHPNNPLGTCYRPHVLRDMITWARQHELHTIVDEIYALSVHQKPEKSSFQSVLQVLDNQLGNDVHMVWAVSKDFGASGLRVGLVYSQNETFMEGLATVSILSSVSGPIQYLVSELLTDDAFVDHFLEQARQRNLHSYRICCHKLDEMVIPYVPAEAGLFVYVDFSSLLPTATFEWEEQLSDLIFRYARIVMTPGESQRDHRPGMFRICYAWVSPEVLQIAMERLSRLVAKVRRMDWSDLGDRALTHVLD